MNHFQSTNSHNHTFAMIPSFPPFHVVDSDLSRQDRQQLSRELNHMATYLGAYADARRPLQCRVLEKLEKTITTLWPDAQMHVYGSYLTGLSIPTSDIDVVITNVPKPSIKYGQVNHLQQLASKLDGEKFVTGLQSLVSATIPIIKLVTNPFSIESNELKTIDECDGPEKGKFGGDMAVIKVDISFDLPEGSHRGLRSSALVQYLCSRMAPLKKLVLVLKQLLLQRGLNDAYTGGLSSYCLTIMAAAVLQRYHLHNLSLAQAPSNSSISEYTPELGSLLVSFFETYGTKFDPRRYGVFLDLNALSLYDQHQMGIGLDLSMCINSCGPLVPLPLPPLPIKDSISCDSAEERVAKGTKGEYNRSQSKSKEDGDKTTNTAFYDPETNTELDMNEYLAIYGNQDPVVILDPMQPYFYDQSIFFQKGKKGKPNKNKNSHSTIKVRTNNVARSTYAFSQIQRLFDECLNSLLNYKDPMSEDYLPNSKSTSTSINTDNTAKDIPAYMKSTKSSEARELPSSSSISPDQIPSHESAAAGPASNCFIVSSPKKERQEIETGNRKRDGEPMNDLSSQSLHRINTTSRLTSARRKSCINIPLNKSMLGVTIFGVDHHQNIIDKATEGWNIDVNSYLRTKHNTNTNIEVALINNKTRAKTKVSNTSQMVYHSSFVTPTDVAPLRGKELKTKSNGDIQKAEGNRNPEPSLTQPNMTKSHQKEVTQSSKMDTIEVNCNLNRDSRHITSSMKAVGSPSINHERKNVDFSDVPLNSTQLENNPASGSPPPAASIMKDATTNVNIKNANSILTADSKQTPQNSWAQKVTLREKSVNLKSSKN